MDLVDHILLWPVHMAVEELGQVFLLVGDEVGQWVSEEDFQVLEDL